ncbi:hypothetical protein ACPB0L_12615, partial [Escherichia coli]
RGCNPTSSKFIHTWLRFGEIMRGSLSAGFPSLTGDHKVIYVAADRHVTSEEILEAAMRLLN